MQTGYSPDRQEIMDRIEVREPYFALKNLNIMPSGELRAIVPVEQPLEFEMLPVSAGEAGRHLAILGSVAAAFANPKLEKHFYLACKALLRREMHVVPAELVHAPLIGRASAELTSKRAAKAHTLLCTNHLEVVYSLEVDYHVMTEPVFAKLYKEHRKELRSIDRVPDSSRDLAHFKSIRSNPYLNAVPIYDIQITSDCVSASLRTLQAQYCSGHFPQYPALPVALLMATLINLTGNLLRFRLQAKGPFSFGVTYCGMTADNLAFAGDEVTLSVRFSSTHGEYHLFHCHAEANGERSIADADLTLVVSDN